MIKAILFDWGDTLMRVLPQFHGAMVDWPKVEAIPGIQNACKNLAQDYKLYLATNASESGPEKVRAALARVEMDQYFTQIFTAHNLGCSKPSRSFYEKILTTLGSSPEEVLMVGDDFQSDVVGSAKVGIRSIWFVPDGLSDIRSIPIQSGEVISMDGLFRTINNLATFPIPTVPECESLLRTYANDPNLLRHVKMVALAAYMMAELCRENGHSIDPILAHRGGLLHDLDKLICLGSASEHGQVANRILQDKGFSKLGRISISHPAFTLLDPEKAPATLEERIVYIADKLVDGDQIVGLKARVANLRDRYPRDIVKFNLCEPLMQDLENETLSQMELDEPRLIEFLNRKISLMQ